MTMTAIFCPFSFSVYFFKRVSIGYFFVVKRLGDLGQVPSKKLADDSDFVNYAEVSYYTYTLPSKSVTISQHTTILNKNKTITPMKSYCTFKEHPQSKDKAKLLHLSLSDTDELYRYGIFIKIYLVSFLIIRSGRALP